MLSQLIITIKNDAYDLLPPKYLGCFDCDKIAFVSYYEIFPIFQINDFDWTQSPSNVNEKTVQTVRSVINKEKIFTFNFDNDSTELKNFIAENFSEGGSLLSTLVDKNNFIFVYQKWRTNVLPYINADWESLKKNYAIYDRDFFLAELNIDDNSTVQITDDKTVNKNFYITFNSLNDFHYQLKRKDSLGLDLLIAFKFKNNGLSHYTDFWKRYKRPPQNEYWKPS
ncbi:MAG: hypothetical protein IJR49_01565 [Treponema sp.]|nr:hypothetical protein [Treponema sp.]